MANATSIELTDLVANGSIAAPTAQALDTGTGAVTLETPATSEMDRIILRVQNTTANNLTVTIVAGQDPPAFRAAIGDVISATIGQNVNRFFGPFEAARFKRSNGKLRVTFTPTVSTIGANFTAYVLPKV